MPELKLGLNDKLMFEATGRPSTKGKVKKKKKKSTPLSRERFVLQRKVAGETASEISTPTLVRVCRRPVCRQAALVC
jgi:hypothetical protein